MTSIGHLQNLANRLSNLPTNPRILLPLSGQSNLLKSNHMLYGLLYVHLSLFLSYDHREPSLFQYSNNQVWRYSHTNSQERDQRIVAEMDATLSQWLNSLPEHCL
jgi:hypothetical protein